MTTTISIIGDVGKRTSLTPVTQDFTYEIIFLGEVDDSVEDAKNAIGDALNESFNDGDGLFVLQIETVKGKVSFVTINTHRYDNITYEAFETPTK